MAEAVDPAPQSESLATAHSLGKQLCDALGIDPSNVTAIRLELSAGEIAQVVVTRMFTQRQGLALCELLTERFDLVACGEAVRERVSPDANNPLHADGVCDRHHLLRQYPASWVSPRPSNPACDECVAMRADAGVIPAGVLKTEIARRFNCSATADRLSEHRTPSDTGPTPGTR